MNGGHVVDGDDDLEIERLVAARVDDRDRPGHGRRRGRGVEPTQEARDLVERALRRRQPDALRSAVRDLLEPFEREREVRAALGGRERVDLVDDHEAHRAQRLARL